MGRITLTNIRHSRKGARVGAVVLKPCGERRAILTQTLSDGCTMAKPLIVSDEQTARRLVDDWVRTGVIEIDNGRMR